jgi:hypothetical protein
MLRITRILLTVAAFIFFTDYSGRVFCAPLPWYTQTWNIDTIPANQFLYNGRIWRNKYFNIKGDQYLFSSSMLDGSITFNGKKFKNIKLLYDIYNDELLTRTNNNVIIQLNKEMVDEFTISVKNRDYHFSRIQGEKQSPPVGYVNILYNGKTSLWVKYIKSIELRAVENKFDSFSQSHKIYIDKDNKSTQVRNKKQVLELFNDRKSEIRDYIRQHKITLSVRQPESFIPVVELYNNLNKQN